MRVIIIPGVFDYAEALEFLCDMTGLVGPLYRSKSRSILTRIVGFNKEAISWGY